MESARWWSHLPKGLHKAILDSITIISMMRDSHDGRSQIYFLHEGQTHKFDPQIEIFELEKRKSELFETMHYLEGDTSARIDDTTYSSILDLAYPLAVETMTADDREAIAASIKNEILHANEVCSELMTVINRIECGEAKNSDSNIKEIVLDRVFCDPFIRDENEVVLLCLSKPSLNSSVSSAGKTNTWPGTKTEFAIKICEEYEVNRGRYVSLIDASRKLFVRHQFADRNWTIGKCYDLVRQVCPQERERK